MAWAVRLAWQDASTTISLRLRPGILAARERDVFWMRGPESSEDLDHLLRQLPLLERFDVTSAEELVPHGSRVPRESLPRLQWKPLADWWKITVPAAALPGRGTGRVALSVVRYDLIHEPDAILLPGQAWRNYAVTAPNVRLKPLGFALCDDGRCLIRGRPVPPLPGTRLYDAGGLLIPCGYVLSPTVEAPLVRQVLGVNDQDLILWHPDGTWERLHPDQFVRATRGAVRESCEGPDLPR